ncbi:glycosyltransferase [Paracoccus yeei]|uniref:glycosyltransferase n=1 Tax=Paracoccus yeei TaxID=147645 RepID=UPI0028D48C8F|nr:glycosyltransferase [Paracoccus yeei]
MTTVLILMATHNGGSFLAEQLDSIAAQSHADWRLMVSDDASSDNTPAVLQAFRDARPAGQVVLVSGPGRGAAANFRSLIRQVRLSGECLAFCDQDDVWHPEHLARGLEALAGIANPLALYGSRVQVCDAGLNPVGLSPLPSRPLCFRNALVQNVISGNTQIMSPAAAALLQAAERDGGPMIVHDWWAYQIITGAGGQAVMDPRPGLLYRQHGANVIGANRGLRSLHRRLGRYLAGTHGRWARQNCAGLAASQARFTPENRRRLQDFAAALRQPLPMRLGGMLRSGVYHQRNRERAGFWLSVLLGTY